MRDRIRTLVMGLGLLLALPLALTPAHPADAAGGGSSAPGTDIALRGDTYTLIIEKEGFRYGIVDDRGDVVMPAHSESGLVLTGESGEVAHATDTERVNDPAARVTVLEVSMSDGRTVRVLVEPRDSSIRFSAIPLGGGQSTIEFRTGAVAPAYGLGDYGAHANGQPDEGTPCGGRVEARAQAELSGTVLTNLTNEGSCKRFVSNFVVFPAQGAGQVLFDEGSKRVALTDSENSLGVNDTTRVDGLYYFVGDMPSVYADYKAAREAEGYPDAEPRQRLFELGWEAYGALAWNTHQEGVQHTLEQFLAHDYPLRFGIIGSGFWPGARGTPTEGSTTSFGMWDDTCDYDPADGSAPELPCPRYPDVEGLRSFFEDNDIAMILGLRNNMKAPDQHEGWNPHYDGDFAATALEEGYFLRDEDGDLVTVTDALFPKGPQYVLDADQPAAVDWFVDRAGLWGVDGFKEDASLHAPALFRDGIWNPLDLALHDAGYDVIVRNAAYSVPGDVLRVNDTYYGTGEDYSHDPDRMPVNMLNFAASGAPNVYTDYVGGTPTAGQMDDPSYQRYFTRNAQLLAVSPTMSFGRGPWEMDDPSVTGDLGEEYADAVSELAAFHHSIVPYIYSAALDSYHTGYPSTMTPLHLAYPDDVNTYDLISSSGRQYEWMLGESLLATPVFGRDFETAQSRDVYLPEGKWIDYASGAVFEGPTTLEDYPLGLDRVPAFVGGEGVLVTRDGGGLQASVYPVSTGTTYEWTDGSNDIAVSKSNTGWDWDLLRITDTSTGRDVPFETDPVTGAVHFSVEAGHDYDISGGGTATHPFPVDVEAPAAPTGLSHEVSDGVVTLSWEGVADATSYSVSAIRGCLEDFAIVGSAVGDTRLTLGPLSEVDGRYRVTAWGSAGAGAASTEYVIEASEGRQAVTVTNEGEPPTCDPGQPPYVETGTWSSSTLPGFDGSGTRWSRDGTATWRADLEPGAYEVSVWYPSYPTNTPSATYQVGPVSDETDGEVEIVLDTGAEAGQWVSLGSYTFVESATLPYVRVSHRAGEGLLRTDAVRFTPIE